MPRGDAITGQASDLAPAMRQQPEHCLYRSPLQPDSRQISVNEQSAVAPLSAQARTLGKLTRVWEMACAARMYLRGMAFLLQPAAQYSVLAASFALITMVKTDETWGAST